MAGKGERLKSGVSLGDSLIMAQFLLTASSGSCNDIFRLKNFKLVSNV